MASLKAGVSLIALKGRIFLSRKNHLSTVGKLVDSEPASSRCKISISAHHHSSMLPPSRLLRSVSVSGRGDFKRTLLDHAYQRFGCWTLEANSWWSCSMGFKRKTCVYCGQEGVSSTADHVLARQFVLEKHRDRLPKVPACKGCNNSKARLEDHLTTVLPFGGRHADAHENLATMIPKRLRNRPQLSNDIARGLEPRWIVEPSGLLVRTSTVLIDSNTLDLWTIALVKGLAWQHWRTITAGKCDYKAEHLTQKVESSIDPFFQLRAARRIARTTIGGGALTYEAAQDSNDHMASVWRLVIYGGLTIGGDDPRVRSSATWIFVRPKLDCGGNRK